MVPKFCSNFVYNTGMASYVVLTQDDERYPDDLKGGTEARLYENGDIRNDKGYMLVPLQGKYTITKEDAATLARRKHEKMRENFAAGVVRGAFGPNDQGYQPGDAWEKVGEHAAKVFFKTDNARGLAVLGDFLAKKGGFVATDREKQQENAANVARGVADGAVTALLRALNGRDQG